VATVEAKPEKAKRAAPVLARVDEALMKPGKYESTPDATFDITIHLNRHDKRWQVVNEPGKGIETETVVMRLWSYDEMIDLRKKSTVYDIVKRSYSVDTDLLDRLKIQLLLVSWTFHNDNPRLKLHHINGILTDEAWKAVSRLQASILKHIIDSMNRVYEYHG